MPTDALIQLQPVTTQTVTFNGTAVVLSTGTPRRGLKARVIVTASSGAGSVVFGIGVSRDGGSTFPIEFQGDSLTLATNGANGEYFIPFDISPATVALGCQVRLTVTYTSTGSITYVGDIMLARPQQMKERGQVYMADLLTEIAPLHTIAATETIGAGTGVMPRGAKGDALAVRIQYLNAMQASGSGVWTFTVQTSYDKGTTWTTVATGAAITLTAVAQNGEQTLNFSPTTASDTGQDWVQVIATLTGSPVTPTLAYRADLVGVTFQLANY